MASSSAMFPGAAWASIPSSAIAKPIPDEPPVISAARSGIFLLQLPLQDFSGCVARQLVEELDVARHLVAGQVLLHILLDVVLGKLRAGADDERLQALPEVRVL